jgi:hypothetical protein
VAVGMGDVEQEVLPIDVKLDLGEHVLTTEDNDTLLYDSVAHPREYEIDPSFVTIGRFQKQPDLFKQFFFKRPVLSTLMATKETKRSKVLSFILDPGSPLSFLSYRSLCELELFNDIAYWNVCFFCSFLTSSLICMKSSVPMPT